MTDTAEISALDKKIIRLLQGEFPLVAEPYKMLAEKIGITEEDLLARIASMREEKKIRKVGAVLRHREVGFTANALCVWDVPDAQMDEVAHHEHPQRRRLQSESREAQGKPAASRNDYREGKSLRPRETLRDHPGRAQC